MIELREYIDTCGNSPFAKWFNSLNAQEALKVNTYITRVGQGNFSRVEGVGDGVYECKIDWGAGFRVYFGKDGERLVILLGGGTKKRQSKDIEQAKLNWIAYKQQKKDS
jgi:putative addiction module killer protein